MEKRFETTLLDCINRIPTCMDGLVKERKHVFAEVLTALIACEKNIREIQLIGSGTSNTAACTAKYFLEKTSGIRIRAILPDEYLHGCFVSEPDVLVIVISQTGTSILTKKCLELAKRKGALTVAMCEAKDREFVQAAEVFLNMNCGNEEHPTRTIGYSMTVFTLMLLGMEIGLGNGHLKQLEYEEYLKEAKRLPQRVEKTIEEAMKWLDRSRWQMLRSDAIIFTGLNSLYGVALEGSTKTWELPKIASFGYDLDECMHGPNYGFNARHCVIVLDDGQTDSDRAIALATYMKNEFKNGLIVGPHVIDENDFELKPDCGDFSCLLYATAIQIQGYRLAEDCGRDLLAPHDNHVMYSYFVSHTDYK